MESLYKETWCRMATDDESKEFATRSGLRQGGPESPPLFNLLLDTLMRAFEDEIEGSDVGVEVKYAMRSTATDRSERKSARGTAKFSWLGYADDIVLFARTPSRCA